MTSRILALFACHTSLTLLLACASHHSPQAALEHSDASASAADASHTAPEAGALHDAGQSAHDAASEATDASPGGDASADASTTHSDAGTPEPERTCVDERSQTRIPFAAGSGAGQADKVVTLTSSPKGRRFDGIGAISGGGGNSRLLIDYPEPQRSQILDFLFLPDYGASLHMLKVEIGGDTQSTDGAEPSHMHGKDDLDCTRGYEWWLMREARKRNPEILLYALSWGAPGWIGNGKFWTKDNVDYHIAWLECAKQYDLTIDYLGGWNEKSHNKGWFEDMHAALAAHDFATKLVGADTTNWKIADDMVSDDAFAKAIDVIGVHYPCGYKSAQKDCPSSDNAIATDKPLWASENGSQDLEKGAGPMARSHNRLYLDGKMTGSLNWPLVSAMVPNLSWEGCGLATASEPWSGSYDLGLQLWVTAHTTQFVRPGFRYDDGASGYLASDKEHGSHVTLSDGNDYSMIIETVDAKDAQTIAVHAGALSRAEVHVWATDLAAKSEHDRFVHVGDISAADGTYWLTLEPNHLYTLSTTTGQCKGLTSIPASEPALALPYAEDFEGYAQGHEARIISDMEGSFEVAACANGREGLCYRQAAPQKPIAWAAAGAGTPFTLVGSADWADYRISSDVMLEAEGSVELMGRFTSFAYGHDWQVSAYYFSVSDDGAWSIYANNKTDGKHDILASGKVAALSIKTWHTIAFTLQGEKLSASVDGVEVGKASDDTWQKGPAGLSVGSVSSSWLGAEFDNLRIEGLP